MDEQEPKRVERGNPAGQSEVQPKEKASQSFVRNGFEIFSFDSKAIVSWGLLSGLVGLIFATLTVYRSFGSQVDERVNNHRELNRKLDKFDYDIENIKEETREMKTEQKSIICQINKGKDCR
ncbi:MAG: hypothetical protein KA968_08175 [Chitinophagaceae bacterium]|nr:hypothetical protein [Chitinophagaceae bacterium]